MSFRAVFGSVLSKLRSKKWTEDDTNKLAEELYDAFSNQGPIVLTGPVVVHNPTSGPAISIVNTAEAENSSGIEISDNEGRRAILGIGLGSRGIFANNFIFDEAYRSDPQAVDDAYGKDGKGGAVTLTPGAVQFGESAHPGPGVEYSNSRQKQVASGFSYEESGTGIPDVHSEDVEGREWGPRTGIGEMLGSLDLSPDDDDNTGGCHPPDSAYKATLVTQPLWTPSDLHGWAVNRCKVLEINADTLTCERDVIGDTITVAKPYSLQRTPFDMKTINGVYYEYLTNQTRTAANATASETQEISPSYDGTTGYSPGNVVYARWVSNGTDIEGVNYIDINSDARAWVSSNASAYVGDDGLIPEVPISGDDGLTEIPEPGDDSTFIEAGPGVPPDPEQGIEGVGPPGIQPPT